MGFTITVYRGDTPTIEFTFYDKDTNEPLDLSGWTLYFGAQDSTGKVRVKKQMSVLEPTQGKAQVALSSADTAVAGRYKAEVEARKDNDILTLVQGQLIVVEDVIK